MVIRIRRSWASPHMVVLGNTSRFYARTNAGKYQLDVHEIRSAFAMSDSLPGKVRQFRDDRIAAIVRSDTPVVLPPGSAKLVLQILPLSSFIERNDLGLEQIQVQAMKFLPLGDHQCSHRFNIDGVVFFSGNRADDTCGYCQVFRSGRVEAVDAAIVQSEEDQRLIPAQMYEQQLINGTKLYFEGLRAFGVSGPFTIMLSIVEAKGAKLYVRERFRILRPTYPIDRDVLILPDVFTEDFPADVSSVLRPIFDAVWNAAGYLRSMNYDEEGNRLPNT